MHLDSCPVCKLISEKKYIKEGDHCFLINWVSESIDENDHVHNVVKVAVAKHHGPTNDLHLLEAMKLLGFSSGKSILTDFTGAVGHWGMRLIVANEIANLGKSKTQSEG
jgi:hypothetical protein